MNTLILTDQAAKLAKSHNGSSKVGSTNIRKVILKDFQIIYYYSPKGCNMEDYCDLDWDIRTKMLSAYRNSHFQEEFEAVGRFLCSDNCDWEVWEYNETSRKYEPQKLN